MCEDFDWNSLALYRLLGMSFLELAINLKLAIIGVNMQHTSIVLSVSTIISFER
jgi:putative Mn2+ efflux pump MntP